MSALARLSQASVWDTADKFLRHVVDEEDYGEYILPFLVLRRLECLLADTKDDVLEFLRRSPDMPARMRDLAMRQEFDLTYYNTSEFDLSVIASTDDHVLESLGEYLDGFSTNVADIWEAFDFRNKATHLHRNNRLWQVIKHFAGLDLHPETIPDVAMGDLYEDMMYRAFSLKGKSAGNFYTPRDAIRLMVDVLFASDDDGLRGKAPTRSIYDPTAGTGGMLLVAERALEEMNPNIDVGLYGQELMDWSYAVGKADLLIQGGRPDSIKQGNTLTDDLFEGQTFDYVLSNPPFGVDWSVSKSEVTAESKRPGSRFSHGLPGTSDGAMLFLCHVVSKLAPKGTKGKGGRGAVVLNGSPLFTGAAESGPDKIRAWLLTNDLVDAIIALPTDMFYGTGIATYVWILDTNKEEHRKGFVQLIDATAQWEPMRKGMGFKRRELSEANRKTVLDAYTAFEDSEISKIVTSDDLGFRDVPVFRPRRLSVSVTEERLAAALAHKSAGEQYRPVFESMADVAWNDLPVALKDAAKIAGLKMPIGLIDHAMDALGADDPDAPVAVDRKGQMVTAPGSKMTERIPLTEDIDEHMEREVKPFAPDIVWNDDAVKVGYEIPVTRMFYTPAETRSLEEIDAEVSEVMASLMTKFQEVRG